MSEGKYLGEDRIKEMVSSLYFENESKEDYDKVLVVVDFSKEYSESVIKVSFKNMESEYYSANSIVLENLSVYPSFSSLRAVTDEGIDREIWHVQNVSKINDSWGPLLYEAGIEVISSMRSGVLMPGRERVSVDARNVWLQYLNRLESEINLHSVEIEFDKNDEVYTSGEWERNFDATTGLTLGYYKTEDTVLSALKELNLLEIV